MNSLNNKQNAWIPSLTANLDIVMDHDEKNIKVVLLKRRRDGSFAVCRVDPTREVVMAPNYRAEQSDGRLLGQLSKRGLKSVLDWTDRVTALNRYTSMVSKGNPASPGVFHFCPS